MLFNIPTLSGTITGALLLSGHIVYGSALPTAEKGDSLGVRQSQAGVCIQPGSTVTASVQELVDLAEELSSNAANGISSPPLIPNCFDLDVGPEAQCLACQNAVTVTYGAAVLECSVATFGCGPFEPLCLAACIAAATFTLYGADQACYCAHANCADTAVRSTIPLPTLPEPIGGGNFNVPGGIVPGATRAIVSNGQPSSCPQTS